jgi:sulfhydrogenase subunit beta (sulfur reductase)
VGVGCRVITEVDPSTPRSGATVIVERAALDALLGSIAGQGYQVLGPTVHDGAIVYREVRSAADLPIGWGDEQDGGTYRLRRREDEAVFGYAVGPQSWKQFLHPPRAER